MKYYSSDMWDLPRWDVAHLDVVRDAQGSYRVTWYEETPAGRRVTAVEVYDAQAGSLVRLQARESEVARRHSLPARAAGRGAARNGLGRDAARGGGRGATEAR